MKFTFLPPPLIMLLTGFCLIPLFYELFKVGNNNFETDFWRLAIVRLTTDRG